MKNVLGLYVSEKTAQAVVLERNSSRPRLVALQEWDNSLFDYAGDDTPGMDEFVDHLSHFMTAHPFRVQRVGVAIDTALLFMNSFPFDHEAPREKIQEHVEWELSEYFPGLPRNTFISDVHVYSLRHSRRYDTVLAVSARRDHIQKLHRGLAKLKLSLDVVDPDHFSADTTLRLNHPEKGDQYFALLGIKEERVDISLVRENEWESFVYHTVDSPERLSKLISDLSRSTNGLESIMLFGTDVDASLLKEIRSAVSIPVEALNTFRMVEIAAEVRTSHDPVIVPFRYAAAVGVALREE